MFFSVLLVPAASDGDSDSITYDIVNDFGKFRFDGTSTRLLEVQSAVDLDTGTNDPDLYQLQIRAADASKTATATVFVSVTSSNDHDPVFGGGTPSSTVSVSHDFLTK